MVVLLSLHRVRHATAYDSSAKALDLLVTLGAPVEQWHMPAELGEARPAGPALTWDDLLDFHLLLQRADWFELPPS